MRRKLPQVLTAGLVLATASGCSYNWEDFPRLGMPTPVTEEAPRILSLWQGSWAAALVTGVLVWGLILWSVFFHRRSRTKVEVPPQTRYNMPIEALYTVVPLIIVSVLFYFTARDESKLLELSDKPAHTINVVGYQWSWGFNYIEKVEGQPAAGSEVPKEPRGHPGQVPEGLPAGRHRRLRRGHPRYPEPAERQPGSDPVAAEGREGPLRPHFA